MGHSPLVHSTFFGTQHAKTHRQYKIPMRNCVDRKKVGFSISAIGLKYDSGLGGLSFPHKSEKLENGREEVMVGFSLGISRRRSPIFIVERRGDSVSKGIGFSVVVAFPIRRVRPANDQPNFMG
ncbi:hypothetical protein AVEN_265341-1 [Araneus ventricosus]|uniref:Uncharacterized protein n=1 Tax=Araneus ventricosus TaxID=182803 RepID=A0A4Y2LJ11_ARAVE|nr:hypothetical protein AVEN_265341-1 [Araneus ventricosus]